jgi:amidohydrolase
MKRFTTPRAILSLSSISLAIACSGHPPAPAGPPAPPRQQAPDRSQQIAAEAKALLPRLIELRRDLHRHPELAGNETRTSGIVARHLEELGLEVRRGVGGHGVIGVLRGKQPGGVVAYRADMDASVGEEPPKPVASTVAGVHHVCGHDIHVAVGLGIATVLSKLRDQLPGTVVFVFQPAEETLQGAAAMIRDGALISPRADAIFAIHAWPLPVGNIAYAPGEGLAGQDEWWIDVFGDSAAATKAVESLGTIAPPRAPDEFRKLAEALHAGGAPLEGAVFIAANTRRGDDGRSVIHAYVKASRDEQYPRLREQLKERLDAAVGATKYKVRFVDPIFPGMYSNVDEAGRAAKTLVSVLGAAKVERYRATLPFAGEDFGLFLKATPGAMFFLGVANYEKGILGIPHQPSFDADEAAIEVGTRAMASVIWQRLGEPPAITQAARR